MSHFDPRRRALVLALHKKTKLSIKQCYENLREKREPRNPLVAAIWRRVVKSAA